MTIAIAPVARSVTVNASAERAFRVFTEGFDSWWPRTHHIGTAPMKRAVIEGFVGGRCYSEQVDGSDCPWGQVLVWDPPRRIVFAWQIDSDWKFEPDLAKSSEVDVRFIPVGDGTTRVDLEHRGFERSGPTAQTMRDRVDASGGWGSLLDLFQVAAERS